MVWVRVALSALLLLSGFAAGWTAQGWRLGEMLAELEAKHATQLVVAQETADRRIRAMQGSVDESRRQVDEAKVEIDRRDAELARLRADARGLRNSLASYASRPTPTCPAGDHRAETLAGLAAEGVDLLAESRELLRACAADHDRRAAEVRALIQGWPK